MDGAEVLTGTGVVVLFVFVEFDLLVVLLLADAASVIKDSRRRGTRLIECFIGLIFKLNIINVIL